MFPRILTVFFIVCSFAYSEGLEYGMSFENVRIELGRPESKMALDEKEVWIYTDGSRVEFKDGKLIKENDTLLTPPKTKPKEVTIQSDPLVTAEEIVQQREDKTISASIQKENIDYASFGESYADKDSLQILERELGAKNNSGDLGFDGESGPQIQHIAIAFGLELLVTFLVLSIAFQVSGFPSIFRQLLLLSLAVAVVGAILDTLIGTNPLSPVRSAAGLVILLLLIRQLTDVREWATAIKIAIIARLVSIAIIWVVMLGLSMLFSM